MTKKNMINEGKSFAFDLTRQRFSMATKVKMGRKLYEEDIHSAWIAGLLTTSEELHNRHIADAYKSADELLGDLQLMVKENFNFFNSKYGNGKLRPVQIEDYFKEV